MEDVGRLPSDLTPANVEPTTIPTLDGWIESLMQCKQLAESDVQRLCEKVRLVLAARGCAFVAVTPPHSSSVPALP